MDVLEDEDGAVPQLVFAWIGQISFQGSHPQSVGRVLVLGYGDDFLQDRIAQVVEVAQRLQHENYLMFFLAIARFAAAQFLHEFLGEFVEGVHVLARVLTAIFAGQVADSQIGFVGQVALVQ